MIDLINLEIDPQGLDGNLSLTWIGFKAIVYFLPW